jgi:methanogenic corrinoid protein MtbC1
MLKWCSYCQQFMGEVPNYQDLVVTHAVCPTCQERAPDFTDSDFDLVTALRDLQERLYEAGRRNDLSAADDAIRAAIAGNIRAIDILVGVVAPLLYHIGEQWKQNRICIAEEQRITAFCDAVYERICAMARDPATGNGAQDQRPRILLMNAPGNVHTMAIRMLALWLRNRGWPVELLEVPLATGQLMALVDKVRPRLLMLSMALAEQSSAVAAIVDRIAQLPAEMRPRIVIGGNAVKLGLVAPIPGSEFVADISALADTLPAGGAAGLADEAADAVQGTARVDRAVTC